MASPKTKKKKKIVWANYVLAHATLPNKAWLECQAINPNRPNESMCSLSNLKLNK